MACAAVAAGADGVHVEVHDCPEKALSDGPQALLPDRFEKLRTQIKPEPGGFEDIPWMTNLWEARRKAAAEGKPMYVWSGGGPPCGFT